LSLKESEHAGALSQALSLKESAHAEALSLKESAHAEALSLKESAHAEALSQALSLKESAHAEALSQALSLKESEHAEVLFLKDAESEEHAMTLEVMKDALVAKEREIEEVMSGQFQKDFEPPLQTVASAGALDTNEHDYKSRSPTRNSNDDDDNDTGLTANIDDGSGSQQASSNFEACLVQMVDRRFTPTPSPCASPRRETDVQNSDGEHIMSPPRALMNDESNTM
jgi:hypothetical protein